MTGLKKNFEGVSYKNSQHIFVFVFTCLLFVGIIFSNKLSAQPSSVSMNIVGSANTCQPAPVKINFHANGTPTFTFNYTSNGIVQPPLYSNSTDTTVTDTVAGVNTYSIVSVSDGLGGVTNPSGSLSFTINPKPQARVGGDKEVCQFDPIPSVTFYGSGGAFPYTMFYTNRGVLDTITLSVLDTLPFPVSTSDPGTFVFALLSAHDGNGCDATIGNDTVTIVVDQRPYARFSVSPDRVSNLEPTVTINDMSIAATNWSWDFGDGKTSPFANPGAHTYPDTGTYTINLYVSTNVNTATACSDNTSQNVRVYLPFTLYIPAAFSPNNDGINDVFTPKGDGITLTEYNMSIYDRWGSKIFYTTDINKGWDGTVSGKGSAIVPIDSYVYVINLVADEDGKTYIFYGSVSSTLR